MEAKGLTIRTFPSPAPSSSSSTTTTTEGAASPVVRPIASSPPSRTRDPPAQVPVPVPDDPAEKSFLETCSTKIHAAVVAHELATHEPTPYALIADAEVPGRKRLLGVIIDRVEFERVCAAHEKGEEGEEGEGGKVEANGVLYPILGVYAKGRTVWWRGGEELKGVFGKEGDRDVEVVWFSRVKEGAERARRDKRREKKERRREMVATSTGAAPTSAGAAKKEEEAEGDEEVGTSAEKPGDEDAQLRAQAKKDKEKARKKAYQARRRQNKKHAKVQEFGGTTASTSAAAATGPQDKNQDDDDEEQDSDDDKANTKTHLRGADLHAILQVLTQRERAAYLSGSRQRLTTTTTRSTNTARGLLPTPRFTTTMTRRPRIIADDSDEATEPDSSSSSDIFDDEDDEEEEEEEAGQTPGIVHVSSLEEGQEAVRQAAAAGSNVIMAAMEDVDFIFGRQQQRGRET